MVRRLDDLDVHSVGRLPVILNPAFVSAAS